MILQRMFRVKPRGNHMTEQTIDFILAAASILIFVSFIAWTVITIKDGDRKYQEGMKNLNETLDRLIKTKGK
jgi:hypothetical protein